MIPLQPLCLATTNVLTLVLVCVSKGVLEHVWIIVPILAEIQPRGCATLVVINVWAAAKAQLKERCKTAFNLKTTA